MLKGVLPKDLPARLDRSDSASAQSGYDIGLGGPADRAKTSLACVYDNFLAPIRKCRGKKGGQFYTPSHVVRNLGRDLAPSRPRL